MPEDVVSFDHGAVPSEVCSGLKVNAEELLLLADGVAPASDRHDTLSQCEEEEGGTSVGRGCPELDQPVAHGGGALVSFP